MGQKLSTVPYTLVYQLSNKKGQLHCACEDAFFTSGHVIKPTVTFLAINLLLKPLHFSCSMGFSPVGCGPEEEIQIGCSCHFHGSV